MICFQDFTSILFKDFLIFNHNVMLSKKSSAFAPTEFSKAPGLRIAQN